MPGPRSARLGRAPLVWPTTINDLRQKASSRPDPVVEPIGMSTAWSDGYDRSSQHTPALKPRGSQHRETEGFLATQRDPIVTLAVPADPRTLTPKPEIPADPTKTAMT